MGMFALVLWLHLLFSDRINSWLPRWMVQQSSMRQKFDKFTLRLVAILVSLVFVAMLGVTIVQAIT